ncbi:MAG TPA: ABC transporter substrate-binding protein [Candidatus Limnocylindrales bacterium]|nr:ABC transporter substrate-binding protein [Candidatus Limnocylindrales bacterium]
MSAIRPSRPARRGARAPLSIASALVAALVLLVACSGGATPRPTVGPDATGSLLPPATATPLASLTAPAFPITLTDDEGTKVELAAEPQKIVSLTPATTETLFALGVGDRVVGKVEDFTPYPPEVTAIPDVAKFGEVDVERIVSLGADLVIAGGNSFNPPDKIAQLRTLGVPVIVVYASDVAGVLKDIELTGAAVGRSAEAADLTASMQAAFDQVAAATADFDKPRVFYELDASQKIYTAADDSFLAEMITLAGGEPITTGSTTNFEIPLETLVTADPELILLGDAAYGTTAEVVKARNGWAGMTAVKTGAIRPVDDVIISRPGPRLVDGLRALALAIHPDAAVPSPAPPASAAPAPAASSSAAP